MRFDRKTPSTQEEPPSAKRLLWQCRRGMLELDYLLKGFLQTGYEPLPDEEKRLFIRMLDFQDQLLLDWLMGYIVPSDPATQRMVERIRAGW